MMEHGAVGTGGGRQVTVTDTGIAHWDAETVAYRGYDVRDLVRESTFTEVAYLLLYGELPDELFLADFRAVMAESAEVHGPVQDLLEQLPLHVSAGDVLRTAVSAVAHFDPQPGDRSIDADRSRAIRLLAQVPVLVSTRFRATRGFDPLEPDLEWSYPAQLVALITGQMPSPDLEKAVEVLLISVIDAGFSRSVQAARLGMSGGTDLYGAVLAAAAVEATTERGDLATRLVSLWEEMPWDDDVDGWVREQLNSEQGLPGLVSLLEAPMDPRLGVLQIWTERLAIDGARQAVDMAAAEVERAAAQWGWSPRWEWSAIRLLAAAGIEPDLHLPLVAVSRLLGWSAHVLDQSGRPSAAVTEGHYVGPGPRDYPSLPVWD